MILGFDYLYADNGSSLKRYIRLGWVAHYKHLNLGQFKLSKIINQKMKEGKIPPHLKGTEVRIYTDKKHFYVHKFKTDNEKSEYINKFKQLLKPIQK